MDEYLRRRQGPRVFFLPFRGVSLFYVSGRDRIVSRLDAPGSGDEAPVRGRASNFGKWRKLRREGPEDGGQPS